MHLRPPSAEVAKTRLQLQGELMKSGSGERVYKNVFEVFVKTWRNEGLRGVQRGLGPAVCRSLLTLPILRFVNYWGSTSTKWR